MTIRLAPAAFAILLPFMAARYACADGFAVDIGDGKLSVADETAFMCQIDLSLSPIKNLETIWNLSLKSEDRISVRATGRQYNRWKLGYDPTGKDPTVFAAKPDTPGIVNWRTSYTEGKGRTIQAAEGPLKDWYLTPGTEKVEMDVRGKKTVVGTKPVLSQDPAYFNVYDVSP